MNDSGFKGRLPVSVHVGDYNLDGYPDLLVVSGTPNNIRGPSSATLLQSVLCSTNDDSCFPSAIAAKRRTFVKVTEGADPLNNAQNVKAAAFFDIDEDVSFISQIVFTRMAFALLSVGKNLDWMFPY